MQKINEFILTFAYSGKIKKAPGTFGSLATLVFWVIITQIMLLAEISIFWQSTLWFSFAFIMFVWSLFIIPAYVKQFDEIDHPSIVIDEVIGQLISTQIPFHYLHHNHQFIGKNLLSYNSFLVIAISFFLFRLLDITKPLFIGYCDRKIKNSFGVIFDDILSGIIASILTIICLIVFEKQ